MKKYCTKCGQPFDAVGREVICPSCKAQAAEETKKAAVMRAKRASWAGESVPVRISGRASTIIRECGKAHDVPFQEALDALLKVSDFFQSMGKAWQDITPYKSHRRDKHATEDAPQDEQEVKQASKPQDKAQDAQDVPQAAKVTQAAKAASKAQASKPQVAKASKASASKPIKAAKSSKTATNKSASK